MTNKTRVEANPIRQEVTLTTPDGESYVFSKDRKGMTVKIKGKYLLIPHSCMEMLGYLLPVEIH